MIPPIPKPEDYGVSSINGFLPTESPLLVLPDPYYGEWEAVAANLQSLLLSRRLRRVLEAMPTLSTSHLRQESEWRRAYVLLGFMAHAYIWGGDRPSARLPPAVSVPFLSVASHLDIPPVATYAALCLWNFKPLVADEGFDQLENLYTLITFTGSLDESWFYMVSIAIEARAGPTIPLMLDAIGAARRNDTRLVTAYLRLFAQRIDELGSLLQRMYENCDSHVFYHRIRPYLAGSKNMENAGLPHGVKYVDADGKESWRQYSGGSNAQSSLIQFFDIILGVEHRPTGEKKSEVPVAQGTVSPAKHNFIQEMRFYMPGPHRRFLEHVASVANIREFVQAHRENRDLTFAYDASLAMLRALRDKHIQLVSRYIIVKSRESRSKSQSGSAPEQMNLASASRATKDGQRDKKKLTGTGGTALIPFLKQARDETGEPAIDGWARKLLSNGPADGASAKTNTRDEPVTGDVKIVGLAGTWSMDASEGGLCHW
ncbi:MAG: hypothetical protein M1817_004057 [Caeruleum heppii]|nr:MAG: hypothetical protein M1817_004057 [Caeruleum heppii]